MFGLIKALTLPLEAKIRLFSSKLSGLWSRESAVGFPSLSQTMALESPTFAEINYGPLVRTIQHVVPEN